MKAIISVVILLIICTALNAQISGTVFRDFNGNGIPDNIVAGSNTAANKEPGVAGVAIQAYNSSDILIASQTTGANGNYSFPVGAGVNQIPNGIPVRLEYVLPQNCVANSAFEFDGNSGNTYGSNVQFKTQSTTATTANFSINYAAQYRGNFNNPKVVVPRYSNGNPVALPAGNAATQVAMYAYNYTANGQNTGGNNARTNIATTAQIGSCWGVAYNKYNDRIYTSALLKRHSGLGPGGPVGSPNPVNAPGSIYVVNPNATNSGSFFFSMDALGPEYYTHDHTAGAVLNVRNNVARGLGANIDYPSADAAALDQVGKAGIGDIELSDDGRYLWLTNLYNQKLYRIDLTNPASPVAPVAGTASSLITSWSLPPLSSSNGMIRPWALKWHKGKIYVGVVSTGENDADANSTTHSSTNYDGTVVAGGSFNINNAYIVEFNPAGAGAWTTTLTIPLNYPRGNAADENYNITRWYNWVSNFNVLKYNPSTGATNIGLIRPQPILSEIQFDVDGTLMIGFMDRLGNQSGKFQPDGNGIGSYFGEIGGDLLRAYNNGCSYELETNGKEGASSLKSVTNGANKGQGPGAGIFGAGGTNYGEFYWDERFGSIVNGKNAHSETILGGLAFLPGSDEILAGVMDPFTIFSNGSNRFNNTTGAGGNKYEIVSDQESGTFAKAVSLGDIELILPIAPIEIGNRVWHDLNSNGIQEAGEAGISGIIIELYNAAGSTLLATTVTDAEGDYYFDNTMVAAGILPNTAYILRIAATQFNSVGLGLLDKLVVSPNGVTGNGAVGLSDNDATVISNRAQISFTTGAYGQNNYNLDFGFIDNPLPLKLVSFTAQLIANNVVELKWSTVTEINVSHFEIERSTDGIHFTKAGTVPAKGNTEDISRYGINDMANSNQSLLFYYRLRSVDTDGKNELSQTRIIRLGKQSEKGISIITYPNPLTNELRITIPGNWQNKKVVYELFDANGKLRKRILTTSSNQTETMNISNLSSGFYIVRVSFEGQIAQQKIIKQ